MLMLVFFENFTARLVKKISTKSVYLVEILVDILFYYNAAIWTT